MIYIAIIGPGESASARDIADAHSVGALCAGRGWITLTGGRDSGVMAAAAEGATSGGGMCIGILPGSDRSRAAASLTASIPTGLGEARNAVLVTAAAGVIACGMSSGTLSEIGLALAAQRPVALVRADSGTISLLARFTAEPLGFAEDPADAVEWVAAALGA